MIVGIDPGKDGGYAILDPDNALAFPLDLKVFKDFVRNHLDKFSQVVIEDVHALYGSSAGGTFAFGRNVGTIEGILYASDVEVERIQPKAWQKILGIKHAPNTPPNERKKENIRVCQSIFPDLDLRATPRSKVPHLGMVDALLIAEAMRRSNVGN